MMRNELACMMHDGRIWPNFEILELQICEAAQEVKFEAILNSADDDDDDGNADGRRIASRREAAAAAADGAMRI